MIFEVIIALVVIGILGYMIMKEYNATVTLFVAGIALMFAAAALGHPILGDKDTTGLIWLDPFKAIQSQFIKQLGNVGLTIMVLFGFSSYTTSIKANEVAIRIMTRPIGRIKSKYLLVPVIFLLGNLLSLVVPSASSLAVLLMATLYPVLKRSGMSSLTAGAIIATTATIIPTPLGADNVIAAKNLGYNLIDYVYSYHAKISIPALIIMAVAHYFWQKYMDKRHNLAAGEDIDSSKLALSDDLPPAYYGLFPVLPLILVVVAGVFFKKVNIDVIGITFVCLVLTMFVELIRKRNARKVFDDLKVFFRGMGDGLSSVVSLLVAASLLVQGVQSLGIVDMLINSVKGMSGAGLVLMFIFCAITLVVGFISGSGLAAFYAFIALIPAIATKAGINGIVIALPMQLVSNLVRSISPVAAVIIVVASIIKVNPVEIVKRTSVPAIVGIIACLGLAVALLPL